MASADHIYVDPSALRSLYVHDSRSARFSQWRKRLGGTLPVSRLGRAELINSISLGVHRKMLAEEAAAGALADLDLDIREERLVLVDALFRRTLDLTAEFSEKHTRRLGTRTLDALHVATALTLGARHFVSYDDRQLALAKAVGLRTVSP